MQKNTKEWIQYGSAVVVLIFAIVLVYISYFTSKTQDVTDNVLWYFAQSLMYAGSIFGVAIAIDAKFENLKNKFLNHNRDEKNKKNFCSLHSFQPKVGSEGTACRV